jgi:hypothetical protein
MRTFYVEINIVAAIVNNDYSGTTGEEDDQIEQFFFKIGGGFLVLASDYTRWERCDITGLYGDCYFCTIEK